MKNTEALIEGGVAEILKNLEIRVQTPYSADKNKSYKREIIQAIYGNDISKTNPVTTFTKTGPSNKFSLSSKEFEQLNQSNQTKNK